MSIINRIEINFEQKAERLGFLVELFNKENDIQAIVDYDTAKFFNGYYSNDEFNGFESIEIASDINEYSIYKSENTFIIEPSKRRGKWLYHEGDGKDLYILSEIADEELLNNTSDFHDYVFLTVDNDCCDCDCDCEECDCCDCCDECCEEDTDITDEELDLQVFLEVILDEINTLDCECCKLEALYKLYSIGFEDGRKALALSLSEVMNEIVEE